MSASSTHSDAYLDIVWKQFKKNRAARIALWCFLPLSLIAIFAPALASNQPLFFRDGDQTLYPWFRALFTTEESVDFYFNMALIGFFPWLIGAAWVNRIWKSKGMPGRQRIMWIIAAYVAVIVVVSGVFSIKSLRPLNRYRERTFSQEEFQSPDKKHGVYVLIPFSPTDKDLLIRNLGPLGTKEAAKRNAVTDASPHWLGTDNTGSDVLAQMIYGTRISMTVGFVAVSLYVTIGVILGAIAGYYGGTIDMVISRAIEVMLLFPSFFLILTLVAMIGPSIYVIMVVIGLTSWPTIARLTRGEVLKQRTIDYVAAARGLGVSHWRIIFRHILPNALSPALVAVPFGVASAIITEANLSLLGFGVRPPAPSWGRLLQQARDNYSLWWLIVIPSLSIFLTVTVFNLVGNGLRDAMDPRLRS